MKLHNGFTKTKQNQNKINKKSYRLGILYSVRISFKNEYARIKPDVNYRLWMLL